MVLLTVLGLFWDGFVDGFCMVCLMVFGWFWMVFGWIFTVLIDFNGFGWFLDGFWGC